MNDHEPDLTGMTFHENSRQVRRRGCDQRRHRGRPGHGQADPRMVQARSPRDRSHARLGRELPALPPPARGPRGPVLKPMSDHEPDLTGMTFHEIAAKYGEEAAIDAGIAADPDAFELTPEWFREARPAAEVMPDLVESYRRSRRLRETCDAATEEEPRADEGAQASCAAPAGARPSKQ